MRTGARAAESSGDASGTREVTTARIRALDARTSVNNSDDGVSAQCASSKTSRTGWTFATDSMSATSKDVSWRRRELGSREEMAGTSGTGSESNSPTNAAYGARSGRAFSMAEHSLSATSAAISSGRKINSVLRASRQGAKGVCHVCNWQV